MAYMDVHDAAKARALHFRAPPIRLPAFGAVLRAAKTAAAGATRSQRRRANVQSLAMLSDRQLRDLGFDRAAAISMAAGQSVNRARWQYGHE